MTAGRFSVVLYALLKKRRMFLFTVYTHTRAMHFSCACLLPLILLLLLLLLLLFTVHSSDRSSKTVPPFHLPN
jgi:hypothetical protein